MKKQQIRTIKMSYDIALREEELKNKIAQDYFWIYDCTKIIGDVDFCVAIHQSKREIFEQETLLWAEAKKGISDLNKSLVQLILTIGKARTFDKYLPPAMLGAFDTEKIAFIPYNDIHEIFYLNDFNWNVTPSNHDSKEFKIIFDRIKNIFEQNTFLFYYNKDDRELNKFIKENFITGKFGFTKTKIDKNNFMVIYNKWLQEVKFSIAVNWDIAKKNGVIDGDFYLADLLSFENETLMEKLFVLLKKDHYQLDRKINEYGLFSSSSTTFTDNQKAHNQFWNKYERPPKEEYWNYIVERRDLLVPQDVRERKGSFFTPQVWVELSQKYLTKILGDNWQDEYYIWDCAAGTGNLLTGLTGKYNIWASTLDKQDVDVMHERIDSMNRNSGTENGANLLKDHVFRFDFLNDEFSKLPKPLQEIINNPLKRKKLVIYINPPYAESNGRVSLTRSNIQNTNTYSKYYSKLEKVGAELFAQFLARIYFEIPDCIIAQFSTLKVISSVNSSVFRNNFLAELKSCFVVPADTFDNVKGKFPIGFFIWDSNQKIRFEKVEADIYDAKGAYRMSKNFYSYDKENRRINDWLSLFKIDKKDENIGFLMADAPDFQNNNFICIQNLKGKRHGIYMPVNQTNIIEVCIYFSVRHCIEPTWLNDRDQFLFPNENWQKDKEFQNDCLTFALFHGQNKITSNESTNNWIPFTEKELNSREKFDSNFITNFITGKIIINKQADLLNQAETIKLEKLEFSPEAKSVFNAGRELWRYYHKQSNCNVNASLYDIKEHFQGRNVKGKMNKKSENEKYSELIVALRFSLKILARKIIPKVYEYEFLKS